MSAASRTDLPPARPEPQASAAEPDIRIFHAWTEDAFGRGDAEAIAVVGDLTRSERARRDRYRFERSRREFALGRALLREVLGERLGIAPRDVAFRISEGGKPELAGPGEGEDELDIDGIRAAGEGAAEGTPWIASAGGAESPSLHFNLSHSHGLVLCAVSSIGPVGIDVETIDPERASLDIARRYFSDRETAIFAALPERDRPVAFHRIWTLKEAYVKALGTGLRTPLADFRFPNALAEEEEPRIEFAEGVPQDPAEWRFATGRVAERSTPSGEGEHDFRPWAAALRKRGLGRRPTVEVVARTIRLG